MRQGIDTSSKDRVGDSIEKVDGLKRGESPSTAINSLS
jgi:hypothetical protein